MTTSADGPLAAGTPIEQRVGYVFQDARLRQQALVHSSAGGQHFERLEFLGDRALGLAIAEWLYDLFPQEAEGALAKRFVDLVKKETLMQVAQTWELGGMLAVDVQKARQTRIEADGCEALIGAIYRDGGMDAVRHVVRKAWDAFLQPDQAPPIDPKSALQEHLQAHKHPVPTYCLQAQQGPSHAPLFSVRLDISCLNATFIGQGSSKRQAEQDAAKKALAALKNPPSQSSL